MHAGRKMLQLETAAGAAIEVRVMCGVMSVVLLPLPPIHSLDAVCSLAITDDTGVPLVVVVFRLRGRPSGASVSVLARKADVRLDERSVKLVRSEARNVRLSTNPSRTFANTRSFTAS